MKLFNIKRKENKMEQWMTQRTNAICHIVARAFTVGEIKNILNELGDDNTKVIFRTEKGNWEEVILVQKGFINENAEQLPSENSEPISFIDCIYVTMSS